MLGIKKYFLFILLIGFCQINLLGQNPIRTIDSLLIILKTAKEDTAKVNFLNSLCTALINISDYKKAKLYADSAFILAESLSHKKGKGNVFLNNGLISFAQGNYNDALKNYKDAFKIAEELGSRLGVANCYKNIGNVYLRQSNYPEALKNYLACLKISEEIGDKLSITGAYLSMGNVYAFQDNYPEALRNYQTSLKIAEEIGDKVAIVSANENIALVYKSQSRYSEALKILMSTLKIRKEMGNRQAVARSYANIGVMYMGQDNYTEALINYFEALKIYEEIGDKPGVAIESGHIAGIYLSQGNNSEALKYTIEALNINEEAGNKRGIASSYMSIASINRKNGNFNEALKGFYSALEIWEKIGGTAGIAGCYIGIGRVNYGQAKYSEALKYFLMAVKIHEENDNKSGLASDFIDIGKALSKQAGKENPDIAKQKYTNALQSLTKGLLMAKEINENGLVQDAYEGLVDAYIGLKDYQKAFEYKNLFTTLKDSLMNNQTTRKLEQQRTQFEVEKAVTEEKVQQEKKLVEQKLENEKKLAEENTKHLLALVAEQAKKEKAIEIEKLKYDFALAEEKTAEEKRLAEQKSENEKNLMEQNALHQQQLADEKAKQVIKDAEANTLLEKEKAAKQRRTEGFIVGLTGLALISIFSIIIIHQGNQKRTAVEKAETSHKMAELELQSLRAQLNPHFMFNSLNAIQDLIVNENNEKSQLYLSRFSKLLRMLLDNADQPFVTVKQEMELIELYLSLENLRIPNLQYSIEKDPKLNTEDRMIPNMMLQPYIENAIWHGLSNKKGERILQIRIHENENATEFEVEDNGIGRKKSAELKHQFRHGHHSKGMQLLSKRFDLLSKEYGTAIQTTITDLEINDAAAGTVVKIDVPFSLSEEAKRLVHDTNYHN